MMVTTCSVGFTAFAADKDKGIWKNSTSADSTFDALTELVDTYVPVLLNQPNIKKALEEKLGMTVTDTTSISDLIMGVSPTLLNLLSSPMNKADIIDGYRKGYSDVAYAYLDEKDAKMSFYQLFSFCVNNISSSDAELAKWCEDTLSDLSALLEQFPEKQAKQQEDLSAAYDALNKVLEVLGTAEGSLDTLEDIQKATVTYKDKSYKVDDLIALDDFKDVAKCFGTFTAYFEEAGSKKKVSTMSEAIWYVLLQYQSDKASSELAEAAKAYLCKLAKKDYNTIKDDDAALAAACKIGAAVLANNGDNAFVSEYYAAQLDDATVAALREDMNKNVPDGNAKIGSSRDTFQAYLNGDYADKGIAPVTKPAMATYWSSEDLDTRTEGIYRRALMENRTVGGMSPEEVIATINQDLLKTFYSGELKESVDEAVDFYFEITDAKVISNSCRKYSFAKYGFKDSFAVAAVNNAINQYMVLLDPEDQEGVTIAGLHLTGNAVMNEVVYKLVESKVDLKGALTDIWMNLYEHPVETIMQLLPVLTVVIDEVLIPMVFNQEGDPFNGFLGGLLSGLMDQYGQSVGSPVGLGGGLSWDLNEVLPTLMHWLIGDTNYDFTYYNISGVEYGKDADGKDVIVSQVYGDPTTGKYDDTKTPVILNIYAADKALQGAKASGIADALKLTGDAATAVNEAVSELATFFTAAVDQYVAAYGEKDAKSGAMTKEEGTVYNHGVNNLFVALPKILDIMGKNFIKKYDVKSADNTKKASDWSYSDYKIKSDTVGDKAFFYNQSLVNFKNLADGGKPAKILDCFVNIFVNDWFNAIIDLLNDVTATDNKITTNLPIITPISKLLDGFYSKPVSVLTNLIKGLSIVMNKDLNNVATAAIYPLYKEIHGVSTILSAKVSNLMPSMAKNDAWFSAILGLIFKTNTDDKDQNAQNKQTIALVTGLLKKSATKAGLGINDVTVINAVNSQLANFGFELPTTLFKDIANCKNAEAVLKYLTHLVVDVLQIRQIIDLLKVVIDNPSISQVLDMISRLTKKDLLNIIIAVIAKTTDPTTAYWTFLQYVQEKTTGFYYPAGVTAQDASDAVGDLDTMVTSVIGLLAGLDVVKQDNLKDLVSSLIFTNANLTKLASALYGAIDPYKDYLGYAGIDVSKKGVAKLLTDGSYGKTYSSAAKAIKNAKSWKKLGNINWGFTDGSAKAQQGFVNGLAAILRPLDGVLSLLLAGDDLAVGQILTDLVKNLNFGSSKDTVQLKNGKLRIRIKGSDKYSKTSVLEINLYKVIEDVKSLSIYGGNGYESAIVPLLEALECPNVKTYKQYKADIKKSTDSVLTDVLNPIVGFLNKVLDAPFDTLTAVLPNVAYYIDNNGLAQLVNNLLSPVTSLLPVLKKNGVDVEVIVKALAGKSLNDLVKDALGVNIHLNLNHLNKCDIQNAIVPLVNKLLKSKKINIQLPKIDWGTLASHGTVSTVKSAAKNSEGYYNRKHVTANQGETLIAVLRYVANLLTKNISGLKSILGGIDAIKDYKSIINAVLDQIGTSSADQIIRALFYLLQENPTNAFWNYSEYQTKDYKFSYPSTVDQDFLKNIPPMLDGLIGSLADLNKLIADAAFKDSTINGMITGIGKALDGVKINDSTNLTALLAQTGIDYSTKTVAKLLTDESYGKTFANAAAVIGSASSWSKVNTSALKWGVKDKDSFFNALAAVMRPFYGVLDVLLNDASLGIFNIVHIPGSNGYSSVVVPLLEAFGCYNIKTQYQYREDISKAYDNILLDIVNSLWDKVEDILNAPLQTLMSMLPNLALFIANDGLLQLIENLFTPVSALLDALKPIVNVNTVLTQVFKAFKVDLNGLLAKVGLKLDLNIDLYDLTAMLKPIIGVDNIVPLLNQVLGMIKIKGKPLGLELMDIDWFQLASHGKVMTDASQAATYGTRVFVKGDASETLIAVLRYLVEVVNYKDNYNTVASLVGSLIGGSDNSSITDVVGTVLNMLKGDTDKVIGELCNLLQQLGG